MTYVILVLLLLVQDFSHGVCTDLCKTYIFVGGGATEKGCVHQVNAETRKFKCTVWWLRIGCHFLRSHAIRGWGECRRRCPHVFHRFEFERVFTATKGEGQRGMHIVFPSSWLALLAASDYCPTGLGRGIVIIQSLPPLFFILRLSPETWQVTS